MVFGITAIVPNTKNRISEVREREKAARGRVASGEGRVSNRQASRGVGAQDAGAGTAAPEGGPDHSRLRSWSRSDARHPGLMPCCNPKAGGR